MRRVILKGLLSQTIDCISLPSCLLYLGLINTCIIRRHESFRGFSTKDYISIYKDRSGYILGLRLDWIGPTLQSWSWSSVMGRTGLKSQSQSFLNEAKTGLRPDPATLLPSSCDVLVLLCSYRAHQTARTLYSIKGFLNGYNTSARSLREDLAIAPSEFEPFGCLILWLVFRRACLRAGSTETLNMISKQKPRSNWRDQVGANESSITNALEDRRTAAPA
jgi:hypothetical protein